MDCGAWDKFTRLHGVSEWAVNEGGGDVQVSLTVHQAHHLGIVEMAEWKRKDFDEVYPANKWLSESGYPPISGCYPTKGG